MIKGTVYTPIAWARWAVMHYGIADAWINGSSVLDPGCGRGSLLLGIIDEAVRLGYRPDSDDLGRLCGIDTDRDALEYLRKRAIEQYGFVFSDRSIVHGDYLLTAPNRRFDIILCNPPWVSFGDMEDHEKEIYKALFRKSKLIKRPQELLLGGSRIDVASLFVTTAMNRDLSGTGKGYFFLPSGLFRSEGAHSGFREEVVIEEYRDLDGGPAFNGAGTRRCLAVLKNGSRQIWPIPWFQATKNGGWEEYRAAPVAEKGSPITPFPRDKTPPRLPEISVPKGAKVRQGVNSGGAAQVFLFEEVVFDESATCRVRNRKGDSGRIHRKWIHPLMSGDVFADREKPPKRWIFLPYSNDGRILGWKNLEHSPPTVEWLLNHRTILENRRGAMIHRFIDKGLWWALLGVGEYAFAPWKVAWEAFGKRQFTARLFDSEEYGYWQGNQALHAYMSFYDEETARGFLGDINSQDVELYLRRLGGQGTKNWAQPGRLRRILREEIPPD